MNYSLIFTGFSEHQISVERSGGAYRIAHYLRQFNWDVEVIDYIAQWSLEDLKTVVDLRYSKETLKWIGVSSTWLVSHPTVVSLCDYIKTTYPEVVIIIGGQGILGQNLKADYYINGFGEQAAKAILEYEFGSASKPYGKPYFNGWAIDALHFYPSWPMEDYTIDYEERDFLLPTDGVSLELSRGCRFACKFCTFPVLGVKEDTSISEELIYNHFSKMYDKWGIKNYTISDETLNDRNAKLEKLSRAVHRSGVEPNLNAFVRIDLLKSQSHQLELLAASRVWGQFYGVETFNQKAGAAVGKGLDPDTVKRLMLDTKSYMNKNVGYYRAQASFIAGLPYETVSDLQKTHNWLVENWKDQSFTMWLLGIPEPNENTKLSAFGEDMSKYGYTRMAEDEVVFETGSLNNRTVNPLESNPHVYWKNPQGNYFTFQRAAMKFDGFDGEVTCQSGNFHVWGAMSLGFTPEQALEFKARADRTVQYELMTNKIQAYIQKKLAL